jgi:glycosyltransferase involved in cell wall biosynthesis
MSVLAAADVPSVMTVHDLRLLGATEHRHLSPRGLGERAITNLARRMSQRRIDAVIGVSPVVTQRLGQCGFLHCSTVPVPVSEPSRSPRPVTDCRDLVVVARLAPDKGVDVVIEAFAEIADRVPDTRLQIAGDGPVADELRRRAAATAAPIVFHGRLDEAGVSELLGQARAVVIASMPSRRPEGSSLALVEAAMHGRPVIASDDPVLRQFAADFPGVAVTPSADVERLAAAMLEVLADGRLAEQRGAGNRDVAARHHSIPIIAMATRQVYADVLARAA